MVRWWLTIALAVLLVATIGCGDDGVGIDVGFDGDDYTGAPDESTGHATLENMNNHAGISIELEEIGISLITDENGDFALISELAEGEWTLAASYPFFTSDEQTFTVVKGRPEGELRDMSLQQRVLFNVLPERPVYTYGETVVLNLEVTNMTDETEVLESLTSPMAAFAVRHEGDTVVGGLFPGQGSEPQQVVVLAGETLEFTLTWTIDNYELEPGEYQIFAVLTDSANYPDYFAPDAKTSELNTSLFSKLSPATITITSD